MFNENPYYRNYRYNNYYTYNSNFIPTYYPNKDYKIDTGVNTPNSYNTQKINKEQESKEKKEEEQNLKVDSSSKKQFRLGPLSICDNSINILGFNIAIDDLIILGLIILLLFQSETDYILIIVLGLILLNIDFSSVTSFLHLS